MHRGNRHQRERRCAGAVDRGQHGRGPVAVVGPRHHLDREALLRCARHPFEHRGGMVVLEHQHARAGRHGEELRGGGDAVGNGRDERNVLRIGVDQVGGGDTCALVLGRSELRTELPWLALAGDADAPGLLARERQRAPRRGVEETDLARNVEQRPLARQQRIGRDGPRLVHGPPRSWARG